MFSKNNNNDSAKKRIELCQSIIEQNLKSNPTVLKLVESIQSRNPKVLKNGFQCNFCRIETKNLFGWYSMKEQKIHICANLINSETQIIKTLIHELVHAYDATRHKNLYCKVRACQEIRAYNIEGICKKSSYNESHIAFDVQFQNLEECLKYCAYKSMDSCKMTGMDDIDAVYDACSNDFTPIEEKIRFQNIKNKIPFNPNQLEKNDRIYRS
eukprot:gene3062-5232_t